MSIRLWLLAGGIRSGINENQWDNGCLIYLVIICVVTPSALGQGCYWKRFTSSAYSDSYFGTIFRLFPLSKGSFIRFFNHFFSNSPDYVPCFVIFLFKGGVILYLSCIFSGLKWTSLNMIKHLSDPNQHLDKCWLTSNNPNVNS